MMMLSVIITGIALASAGTITRTVIGVLPSSSLATSKSNQSVNIGVNTTIQHTNATENMVIAFKAADSLLM